MPERIIESALAASMVDRKPYYGDVVVIGYAELTPQGNTLQTRQAMLKGSPIPTKMMDSAKDSQLRNPFTRFYAPLPDSFGPGDPEHPEKPSIYDHLRPEEQDQRRELSYNAALNLVVGRAAIWHAGLLEKDGRFFNKEMLPTHLVAVMMASGYGPTDLSINIHEIIKTLGPRRIKPSMAINMFPEQPNYRLMRGLRLPGGFPLTLSAACASSSQTIAMGVDMIRQGYVIAIAGGVEGIPALKEDLVIGSFTAVRALSQRNEGPEISSRPFDAARDGFLASAGVGAVVLAQRDWAEKMGLTIYARINRRAVWNDANPETTQANSDVQARELTRMLLVDSRAGSIVLPDVIAAHATSTPLGDRTEINAYYKTFGRIIYDEMLVYAPKSTVGHLLGASGVNAVISAVLTSHTGLVPPIANLQNPQAYTDQEKGKPDFKPTDSIPPDMFNGLNFVTGQPQKLPNKPTVLVGNQGFGSHNAYVLVEPV